LAATGALNSDAAGVLAAAVNEHVVAHRRYVRLDLSGVTSVDDAAVAVLAEIHSRLLAERGTLILTEVDSWLRDRACRSRSRIPDDRADRYGWDLSRLRRRRALRRPDARPISSKIDAAVKNAGNPIDRGPVAGKTGDDDIDEVQPISRRPDNEH
jgi:ABC-type transporter Mla MlaB component